MNSKVDQNGDYYMEKLEIRLHDCTIDDFLGD